jgi:hypothetical protein
VPYLSALCLSVGLGPGGDPPSAAVLLWPFTTDLLAASGSRFGIEEGPVDTETNDAGIFAGDTPLACIGRVTHRDHNGVEHEIGFCRKFGFRPDNSETVPDPDYEYAY